MAGAAADRELTTRFAIASGTDDAAIRRLLRENPMRGAVSMAFAREPCYFDGADIAGGEDQTIAAFDNGRLACVGRCTRRESWVNGRATRTGYLAELRLDTAACGRFRIVRDGYEFFREQQRDDPAEFYFTSIAADNARARRLLESGARGLPRYDFLAGLDTLLIAVPRGLRRHALQVERATPRRIPDMVRVLNSQRRQLAAVWTRERLLALERHGLPLDRFLLALDGGEVVACGAVWDQRAFRQTVIRGYSRPLALMRPLVNFAGRILGTPRLPVVGSALAHAFLSPLGFADGAEALLPDFVAASFPLAAQCGAEFLTLAVPSDDPRLPALRRCFSTRTWTSRLYQVCWPEMCRNAATQQSPGQAPKARSSGSRSETGEALKGLDIGDAHPELVVPHFQCSSRDDADPGRRSSLARPGLCCAAPLGLPRALRGPFLPDVALL
jgi:hypothetical protein